MDIWYFTCVHYVIRIAFAQVQNPTLITHKSIMLNFPTHFNTLKICFSYKAKEKSTEKLSSSLLASISQYRGRGRLTAKLLYICFGACVYKYVCESYYHTLHLLPQLLNFGCLSDILVIQIIISIIWQKIQKAYEHNKS